MKVGDLVRVKYDGTVGLVQRVDGGTDENGVFQFGPWIYLHTGESFKSDKLELVNESR